MNHQEIQDLLPLYAIGGLDEESVTIVEQHLAEPGDKCVAELREWQEIVGSILLGVAPQGPRSTVKERLVAQIRQDRQDHEGKIVALQARRRLFWVTLPLAAAAAVLIAIGGLRYREAMRFATEQGTRTETVATLLRQAQEKLANRDAEIQRLNTSLAERQSAAAEKSQRIAQLEAVLTEHQQLVTSREQELRRAQATATTREQELRHMQQAGKAGQVDVASSEREIAHLEVELTREREVVTNSERELYELRAAMEQQRLLVAAHAREVEQLRAALARQRGVIEVLTSPGLQVGYLHHAKLGVSTQGHVLWNERNKAWLFYAFGMPQPPEGKEYQVWFMTEKEGPVSAGLFSPDQTGTGQVLAAPPPKLFGKITAVAVTLEPAGGLPKPSGEMYLRGSL